MTGIPPETLRSWETRNLVVRPVRTSGGFRLYTVDDVERLKLIRALTDLGNPVGTIAELNTRSLRDRLAGLQEPVRQVEKAIEELRRVVTQAGVTDLSPKLTASLEELEALLEVLRAGGRSVGS